jgi:hypothetical protein
VVANLLWRPGQGQGAGAADGCGTAAAAAPPSPLDTLVAELDAGGFPSTLIDWDE